MIRMTLVGLEAALDRIDEISPTLAALLVRGTKKIGIRMQTHIRSNHLSGQTLSRRSNTLSQNIKEKVIEDETKAFIEGRVFVAKPAFYGKIHEFGGTFLIPAHFREQTHAWGRRLAKPKRVLVRAHLATFPKRPFMRPTLRKFTPTYRNMVRAAAREAVMPGEAK